MADTLVKPIMVGPAAVGVSQVPGKQTNQPVQRKIVSPLSQQPTTMISPVRPNFAAKREIDTELAEIERAWGIYRSTNSREAVYIYPVQGSQSRYAMATSRLCAEEIPGGASP